MPKPITPLVGCDAFVLNEKNEVLLIQRADNGFWALPGGCHDLGETPKECAERECREESGYEVEVVELLGVYSSNRYAYVNYPWKDNEFCHVLYRAKLVGGSAKTSSETTKVGWFREDQIPPLSDGHDVRIRQGFWAAKNPHLKPFFE
ncbi:MAG: NUDIX domain-containing protein [Bdellovibrionaceae bacterium]|nr:NUDIX domain-containing protein [Pseudobdellovibrionaceae bacterium]